jgi:hypothetical protein
MNRLFSTRARSVLLGAALVLALSLWCHAQEQDQYESDLVAKGRVFNVVGAGFRAIRRGPKETYYILTAPAPAVQIYNSAGKLVGQIPNESTVKSKGAAIVYGESFDVDSDGRVVVCDRGADAVKIYSPDGSLTGTIAISSSASVVLLPGGEIDVATTNTERLVTAYDLQGKIVRDYGDREEIADRSDINRQVNLGHLEADEAGNTYFAFEYLPEPTVRKFDHAGFLAMEISLKTPEFQPAARAARMAIERSETGTPALHRIISAIGVDPSTQDVWIAIGTLLMHFDKDGQRVASFRTYLRSGVRIEAETILVEPNRLIIGADPQGTFEFPKPAKLPQ